MLQVFVAIYDWVLRNLDDFDHRERMDVYSLWVSEESSDLQMKEIGLDFVYQEFLSMFAFNLDSDLALPYES